MGNRPVLMDARDSRSDAGGHLGSVCRNSDSGSLGRAVLLLGIGIRIAFWFLSQNAGGDATARLEMTQAWLQHPYLKMDFNPWLPVHFWAIGGVSLLVGNVTLGGRLLSLLCGCASVVVFWRLVSTLYTRTAALLSLVVFSFYSLHIGYSSTSSSEATYLFLVLVGLAAIFGYLRSGRLALVAAAGIALTIDAGIRYEAWIFIFACGLVILLSIVRPQWMHPATWSGARWQALMLYCVTAGLWPAIWLVYEFRTMGHPLYFVAINHQWVAEQIAGSNTTLTYRLSVTPVVLLLTLTIIVLVGALWTIWAGLRHRELRAFVVVVLIFAAIQVYQILSGGVMTFARYTLTLGTLLAALSGPGLARLATRSLRMPATRAAITVALLMAANLGTITAIAAGDSGVADRFKSISPRLQFRHHLEDAGRYVRAHVRASDALLLDNFNDECNSLRALAGVPLAYDPRVLCVWPDRAPLIPGFLRVSQPRYLVYSDQGNIRSYLPLPPACSDTVLHGILFHCLHANEIYRIYELTYQD